MNFLCWIGWHRWAVTGDTRKCKCCPKSQHLHEEAALEWAVTIWVDD